MGGSFANEDLDLQAIEKLLGASAVFDWETLNSGWQVALQGAVAPGSTVCGVVFPGTQTELAEVMTHASHQRWTVLPVGCGSKLHWGGLVRGGQGEARSPLIAISTGRMNRLIDHAVGDLTVTVEAGMGFADLQATLAKAGQFLAIDPAFPERATIGGIVATADTGSLRHRYNSVRDMLLGLSLVRADGQLARAGGRVVKNVAGYDLMKLFTGSYGTLGVITQVTFRVYPLPETSQTVVLAGKAELIAQATAALLSSALTPVSVDLLSAQTVQALDLGCVKGMAIAVRFQGIQPSVEQQVNRILELGQSLGLASVSETEVDEALWERLRKHMTAEGQERAIACKIGISPSEAVSVIEQMDSIELPETVWYGQIHAASGLGRLVFPDSVSLESLLKLRSRLQTRCGFLSILQAPVSLKQQIDVWGYSGNALDLMRKLKQQFDPNYRLSPHRFVGGI
ncbi:FAD-binding oxidoreductase [Leptothermofonsia sp. ETS-13]|uniref:FAD-binding oxidoreductase n=1 Tax=Leptothermofonsia sp. ETS-13 TaxID=3035696 RepID=UPI003B9E44F3